MAYDTNSKRAFTVYTNNTVSLNGTYVGRIDHSSYQTSAGIKGKTTFFTASGDFMKTGYDTPHKISAPLYVGGGSNWKFNEAFISEIEGIAT